MSDAMPGANFGRHVFGMAAIAFGVIMLAWHEYNGWHLAAYVVYPAAAAEILGGAAIQFRQAAKTGAFLLGAVYLAFALSCVPKILAAPAIYNSWGNFFEQFSLASGAAILYAWSSPAWPRETVRRIGRVLLGVCNISFALEQAFYLRATAGLVPKWAPPGQMFWAAATTVFFALGAAALLINRMALPAARLLTKMLALFGLAVWVPLVTADPHNHGNWSEFTETFAIRGSNVDSRRSSRRVRVYERVAGEGVNSEPSALPGARVAPASARIAPANSSVSAK